MCAARGPHFAYGRASALVVTLALSLSCPGMARAQSPAAPPEMKALVRAFSAADRATLDYLGQRAGARGLAEPLTSTDRRRVLAAISAAPSADDGWALLPALARLSAGRDHSIAAPAARASAAIAAVLDRDKVLHDEIPLDRLRVATEAFTRIAAEEERWPDVRVNALETAAGVSRALGKHTPLIDWAPFVRDGDPEVRLAAIDLMPRPLTDTAIAQVAARIDDDSGDEVAIAAGCALCAESGSAGNSVVVARELSAIRLERLRNLLSAGALPLHARFGAAMCFVRATDRDSLRALSALRDQLPADLRARLDAALRGGP